MKQSGGSRRSSDDNRHVYNTRIGGGEGRGGGDIH